MIKKFSTSRFLCAVTLSAYLVAMPAVSVAQGGYSLLDSPSSGGSDGQYGPHVDREFFSTNKENRFLIKVHVWGDTGLAGIHHIPDNSTLLDVMGFAGGPTGYLDETTITLTRTVKEKDKDKNKETERDETFRMGGKELLANASYRNMPLANGDVIYLEAPPKVDQLTRNLTIVSTIFSILATAGAVYLIAK